MSWKDSRIFQVCQEFKVLLMSLKSISRSRKFKLYCRLLFLQIKGIQHATIGHYWSHKKKGMFLWVARFNEQCTNLANVFNLSKNNMGEFFQWTWFTWRHQALYHWKQGLPLATMDNGATNKLGFCILCWKHYSTRNSPMLKLLLKTILVY
jgi:hypothetical protein